MRRITPEGRLADYHHEVGSLWRSRNDEPEAQEFDKLPPWMHGESMDTETRLDLQKAIPEALDTISPKERKVLLLRFWFDMTLDECGDLFELTRERIRQIEAGALRKLRHPMRSTVLKPLLDVCPVSTRRLEQSEEKDWNWLEDIIKRQKQRQEDKLIKKMYDQREIKWRT
tara:strand:+ start:20 stop:532 length:513 start_codon:yes stop_codon:yes gene_type:complete